MKFVCIALLGLILASSISAQSQAECANGSLAEGYYSHNVYCNRFFSCSLGYWIEHTCYGDGVWNSAQESCDYRENVNCGNLVGVDLGIDKESVLMNDSTFQIIATGGAKANVAFPGFLL